MTHSTETEMDREYSGTKLTVAAFVLAAAAAASFIPGFSPAGEPTESTAETVQEIILPAPKAP